MSGRGIKKVLDDLRTTRILVLHPRDDDGDAPIRQLRRIGCDVRAAWPIPDEVPKEIDLVFVLVEHAGPEAFPWTTRSDRPFGIMSSLVLARALGSYHARLEAKVNKLEETLRARRDVEKAIRILMELKSIEEGDAYRLLRDQAQAKRLPIGQIAPNI